MRIKALIASVFLLVAWPSGALGNVIVSLNNPGSTTLHEIEVERGETFSVDVNIDPSPDMVGIRFKLGASTENVLTLTDGTFYDPFDMTSSVIPFGPLVPMSEELSASVSTFDPQPVSSPLGTLSLTVDTNAMLAAYTLNLADIFWAPSRATEILPGTAGQDFYIQVVPEPSSLLAASVLFSLLLVRRSLYKH